MKKLSTVLLLAALIGLQSITLVQSEPTGGGDNGGWTSGTGGDGGASRPEDLSSRIPGLTTDQAIEGQQEPEAPFPGGDSPNPGPLSGGAIPSGGMDNITETHEAPATSGPDSWDNVFVETNSAASEEAISKPTLPVPLQSDQAGDALREATDTNTSETAESTTRIEPDANIVDGLQTTETTEENAVDAEKGNTVEIHSDGSIEIKHD